MNSACRLSRLLPLLTVLMLVTSTSATITVLETGEHYASSQNDGEGLVGRRLRHGLEYPGRLQMLEHCPNLCPQHAIEPNYKYNLTIPPDGTPVALLVKPSLCTLQEQLDFLDQHVNPSPAESGVLQYLLFSQRSIDGDDDYDPLDSTSRNGSLSSRAWSMATAAAARRWNALSSALFHSDSEVNNEANGDDEGTTYNNADSAFNEKKGHKVRTNFFVVHMSYRTMFDLEEVVQHSQEERLHGGPQITIDSRTMSNEGSAAVWVGVLSICAACCCSCLLITTGSGDGGIEYAPPTDHPQRPTRTRLTKQQVKDTLPVYHYDGTTITLAVRKSGSKQQTAPNDETGQPDNGSSSGGASSLEFEVEVPDVETLDLCCSICIDDYEPGDRLRILPCQHVFHSKCIARWLSERSSTCPLCKFDLLEPLLEAEENEDDGDDEEAQQGDSLTAEEAVVQNEGDGVSTWFLRGAAAAAAAAGDDPSRSSSRSSSWWSRLWRRSRSNDTIIDQREAAVEESAQEMLTEPLLDESARDGFHQEEDVEAQRSPSATPVQTSSSPASAGTTEPADITTQDAGAADNISTTAVATTNISSGNSSPQATAAALATHTGEEPVSTITESESMESARQASV